MSNTTSADYKERERFYNGPVSNVMPIWLLFAFGTAYIAGRLGRYTHSRILGVHTAGSTWARLLFVLLACLQVVHLSLVLLSTGKLMKGDLTFASREPVHWSIQGALFSTAIMTFLCQMELSKIAFDRVVRFRWLLWLQARCRQ
ncbi:hypothetical protein BC835DRAFT_82903 [Cytidiella melzeri]|nr:hypothetical protein BC835DRAFT_82903 [Cytidiella melzeri]